jgi:hypothetical protein
VVKCIRQTTLSYTERSSGPLGLLLGLGLGAVLGLTFGARLVHLFTWINVLSTSPHALRAATADLARPYPSQALRQPSGSSLAPSGSPVSISGRSRMKGSRFAADSLLEEDGFEPSVPRHGQPFFATPAQFRLRHPRHRVWTPRPMSRSEKSGRSETRASASCIAQPTGAAANDIGADDRQAAGDQIIATRRWRRS